MVKPTALPLTTLMWLSASRAMKIKRRLAIRPRICKFLCQCWWGFGNWNHQGGQNSGDNTAPSGSRNKDDKMKSVSFSAGSTCDNKSASGGNKDKEGKKEEAL